MQSLPRFILTWAVIGLFSTTQAAWQRLPSQSKRPVEVAVSALQDTRLENSSRISRAEALLTDEVTPFASIPQGKSEAVLSFGRQAIIERVSFHNLGGEGKFSFSASPDQDQWTPIGQILFTPADVHVVIPFAAMQCKYVKIEFDLERAAEARHFEVFGRLPANFKGEHGQITNMATSLAGARVIYVNPAPQRGADEAANYGSFDFPESEERYRTVVYDLGAVRTLNEFGSVHSTRPVRFEVFAFQELPEKEDWRGRRSFDPEVFDKMKPVASHEDKIGRGYLRIKAPMPVTARYVAMRWEPDFNPPAFQVAGAEIIAPPTKLPSTGAFAAAADPFSGNFVGAFAPNSLMGAGAGGLPFILSGGSPGPGPGTGGGGGGGGGIPPDVPGPSPGP